MVCDERFRQWDVDRDRGERVTEADHYDVVVSTWGRRGIEIEKKQGI